MLELLTRQRLGLSGHCGSPTCYPSIRGGLPALPQLLAAVSAFGRSTDLSPAGDLCHLPAISVSGVTAYSRLLQLPSIDLLH